MLDQDEFRRIYIQTSDFDEALGYAITRIKDEQQSDYYAYDAPLYARLGAILGRAIAYAMLNLPLDKARYLDIRLTAGDEYIEINRDEYERRALAVLWQEFQLPE
jgi:hypothetical protein